MYFDILVLTRGYIFNQKPFALELLNKYLFFFSDDLGLDQNLWLDC